MWVFHQNSDERVSASCNTVRKAAITASTSLATLQSSHRSLESAGSPQPRRRSSLCRVQWLDTLPNTKGTLFRQTVGAACRSNLVFSEREFLINSKPTNRQ